MKKWKKPDTVFVAPSADVMGDVEIGPFSSIWYQAVVRGDLEKITIGEKTNIQDGCVLHADPGAPLKIGNGVTVGHHATLHGCFIGDHSLIGMGAIVLNGAVIGENCLVGAGALVTGSMKIPAGSLILGSPAKIKRSLKAEEIAGLQVSADEYIKLARMHSSED